MGHTVTASRGAPPSPARVAAPSLGQTFADLWRSLAKDLRGGYRPERHYMRGPGPKWHEKHAKTTTLTAGEVDLRALKTA